MSGFNQLHIIIIYRNFKQFECLSKTNEFKRQAKEFDNFGNNALMLAIMHGFPYMYIKMLIDISDVKHKNKTNETALLLAVQYANSNIIIKNHIDILTSATKCIEMKAIIQDLIPYICQSDIDDARKFIENKLEKEIQYFL